MGGGGGVWWNKFPTFDTESKFDKIHNSHVWLVGGGGWNQFPTYNAESKFAKIQNSHVWLGGGGVCGINFQLLMPSPNLLKSKLPMFGGGGGEGSVCVCVWNQFPTFDTESKFAKIQTSHVWWGGGGGWWN